ncbi:hypothetical protein MLD38_008992 [Melastoma candidum]|uniref:Uncharacterized protein n=1 Tax=Melastoma candidum TaxID=119954 RepID=A0ACB9RVJ5_9MYRT|nr:hypothetical protein MLD38_008992 [Melastoma candidum]
MAENVWLLIVPWGSSGERLKCSFEKILSVEREKIDVVEKMADEAKRELERLRTEREEDNIALMKSMRSRSEMEVCQKKENQEITRLQYELEVERKLCPWPELGQKMRRSKQENMQRHWRRLEMLGESRHQSSCDNDLQEELLLLIGEELQQSFVNATLSVKDGAKRLAGECKEGVDKLTQKFKT